MAQVVQAVVTDLWREKMARLYAGDTSLGAFTVPAYFKIGEGGFTDPGSGKEPKTPDPTFTDLEAVGNPAGTDFVFQKTLLAGDLTYTASTRLEVRCLVLSSEGNGPDSLGNPPEYFELGVFDSADRLLVYSTFPIEIKTASKALDHLIFVDF